MLSLLRPSSKLRNLPCDKCTMRFCTKRDLERHRNSVHEKKQMFFCEDRSCSRFKKGWSRVDLRNRHTRTVHSATKEPTRNQRQPTAVPRTPQSVSTSESSRATQLSFSSSTTAPSPRTPLMEDLEVLPMDEIVALWHKNDQMWQTRCRELQNQVAELQVHQKALLDNLARQGVHTCTA